MKKKMYTRGFTLIELLVVIAIIGILAAVVLASLNTARSKGAIGAIKNQLSNSRRAAELFYDGNASYAGVCALTGTNVIGPMINAAEKSFGNSTPTTYALTTASTYNSGQCHDSSTAWAAWSPLSGSTSTTISGWCVDSTGASKAESVVLGASVTVCP